HHGAPWTGHAWARHLPCPRAPAPAFRLYGHRRARLPERAGTWAQAVRSSPGHGSHHARASGWASSRGPRGPRARSRRDSRSAHRSPTGADRALGRSAEGVVIVTRRLTLGVGAMLRGFQEARQFGRIVMRFRPYLRPQVPRLILAMVGTIGFTVVTLLEPWPLQILFDAVLLKRKI